MLAQPVNDRQCLDQLTALIQQSLTKPDLHAMAHDLGTLRAVVDFIRSRPQRDDSGEAGDGPRVACDVSQRARLPETQDPNCVERTLLYCALAEIIDPRPTRQLATMDTPIGRHTFPVENGRPVRLDPRVSRNGLAAGLYHEGRRNCRNAAGGGGLPHVPPGQERFLLLWVCDIAEEPAVMFAGVVGARRVARARRVLRELLTGRPPTEKDKVDLAFLIDAADEAATLWGTDGKACVRWVRGALRRLDLLPQPRNCGCTRRNCGCAHDPRHRRRDLSLDFRQIAKAVEDIGSRIGRTFLEGYGLGFVADELGLRRSPVPAPARVPVGRTGRPPTPAPRPAPAPAPPKPTPPAQGCVPSSPPELVAPSVKQ